VTAPVDWAEGGEAVRVAIVDDHRLLAESLSLALEGHGVLSVEPTLESAEHVVEFLLDLRPDLVLLDLDLGPIGDGARLVRPLVEAGLRVLIVTGTTDVELIAHAVEEGAVGVIPKDGPFSALVDDVLAAAHDREVMQPRERLHLRDTARTSRERRMAALAPFGHLTRRECEVLRALTEGRNVAEIARAAVVSEATVRSQVQSILTKVGVRSQLEAVVAAHRSGWADQSARLGC
jgi:two-component system nitrate/nitrite response regulator NarL